MEYNLADVAARIQDMREILEITEEDMAAYCGCTVEKYREIEKGEVDVPFSFIQRCAKKLDVDLITLVTGESPHLSYYSIVRKGMGMPIKRRSGFTYFHLAENFKDKMCEPLYVTAPYKEEEQNAPIALSAHEGQEFDYVLKGQLKVAIENHIEILEEGDSIIYDSSHGHGMIAVGGKECVFLAITIK